MEENEFEPIQDSYFPEYDQIEMNIDSLIDGLQKEINNNLPGDSNSQQIHQIYELSKDINKESID